MPAKDRIAVVIFGHATLRYAATALDIAPRRIMQLAGAQRNTAFTEMDLRPSDPRLVSFNNIPHLPHPHLVTLR